ncbi:unnamed protein product [Closterium sp. Naga37s-1]|nr:unnamed protein product [Closterium sp. Naga37s-1]
MSTSPLLAKSAKDAFIEVMLMPGGNLEAVEALYACCQVDVFVHSMARLRNAAAAKRQMLGLVSPPQLMHAEPYTVRDMLTFQPDPFAHPMLRLHHALQEPAARLFGDILRFMGLASGAGGATFIGGGPAGRLSPAAEIALVARVLQTIGEEPLLRDELFLQLQKQTRVNDYRIPAPLPAPPRAPIFPSDSCIKAWELMRYCAYIFPPTTTVATPLVDYFTALAADPKCDPGILGALRLAWKALEHGLEHGPRETIPGEEEVRALLTGTPMVVPVFLCNDAPENIHYGPTTTAEEAVKNIHYGPTTTAEEAVKILCKKLQVSATSPFALYTSRATRPLVGSAPAAGSASPAPGGMKGAAIPPAVVEHVLLPRSAYISDLLVDYGTAAQVGQSRGQQVVCKLLLRKRWFDRADADVAERQFVRLCYVQLRRDYMESRYLVTAEGAVVLAALEWLALMTKSVPAIVAGAMSEDDWAKQIAAQYKTLWSLDHEGTMREFTRIILDSPHGGSVFFPLRPHPDIAASFPKRMEVGINHNGSHFLNPEDHSLVLEAELKDIAEYAGKPGRVYFSLLMRNQLCPLEFATKGGDEITQLLDHHIANAVRLARGEHVGVESESGIEEGERSVAGRGVEKGRVMVRQEGLLMPSLRMSQGVAAAAAGGRRVGREGGAKGRVMVRQEGLLMLSLRMSQGVAAAAAVSHGSSRLDTF